MRTLAVAIGLLAATAAAHHRAEAAEINAFISTAIKTATDELLPPFERANGHAIRASYAPSGALIPRFERGEPVDVFLTDSAAIDALIKQGKIVAGRIDLARTGIGIAVRKGAPRPDVSSAEALKRALLAAKSVGYAAPSGGSITAAHIMGVFAAARHRRRSHAEGQARRRRPQRPRQRTGVERRSRDRAAAGVGADVEPRGRGDRYAAGGVAADRRSIPPA